MEGHVAPNLDGVGHVLVADVQTVVGVERQRFVPQILKLAFWVSRTRLDCERAVNLGLHKFVVDAIAPVVQPVTTALSVPEWPANRIDGAAEARNLRARLFEFGEVFGRSGEAQRRRLALLPRFDEPRQVERRLPVRSGVVGRQGQRKRVVQPDRQPDDLGVAGWHQEAQRRIVQRPHGALPVVLVSVKLVQVAARTLAHAPATGQPAIRAVSQSHLAAIKSLPSELALVALAI